MSRLTASLADEAGPIRAEATERVGFPCVRRVWHASTREPIGAADLRNSRDHVPLHVALERSQWVVVVTSGGSLGAVIRREAVDAMATARKVPIERFDLAPFDDLLGKFIHLEVEREHADPFAFERILVGLV